MKSKTSKSIFMLNKLWCDFKRPRNLYPIPENLSNEILGYYYFKFSEKELLDGTHQALIKTFDESGIPLNSAYIDVKEPKLHYYPISIGQYGLAVFHSYLDTKSEEKKTHFLNIADWFYDNAILDDKLGVYWLTDVPKPEYKVENPWMSAFSQSRALSVLLRAWQISKNEKYLDLCKKTLIPFTYDIEDGGVSANLKTGFPFYEEYVASQPTMVLDGHIFSLFGLYDFVRAVPDYLDSESHNQAKALFNSGIKSLIQFIPEYDMGFWLRFNLCRMPHYPKIDPCTIGYIRLVNLQLKILYKLTGNKFILDFQKRVTRYDNGVNIIKMYIIKYKALKTLNRL